MRQLDTSSITQAAQFPVKQGTLVHLQLAYQEALNALALAIIGPSYNANNAYILFGCQNTGAGAAVNISSGAVYYNGEVFLVDQTNFFLGAGQVPVANIQSSLFTVNADPVLFTDNVQRNVHQIRKIAIVPGASGSGQVGDFSGFTTANVQVSVSGAAVSGAYPNFEIAFPPNRILASGTVNVGNVGVSGTVLQGSVVSSYNVTFNDLGTANYIVLGMLVGLQQTNAGQIQDASTDFIITAKTNNAFTLVVKKKDNTSGNTNLNFDYVIMAVQ